LRTPERSRFLKKVTFESPTIDLQRNALALHDSRNEDASLSPPRIVWGRHMKRSKRFQDY
jgi:hypothetical protein